jgi:hypothetical protein
MVALPFVCAEMYASVNRLLVYPFDDRYDTVAIIEGVAGLVGVVAVMRLMFALMGLQKFALQTSLVAVLKRFVAPVVAPLLKMAE